MKKKVKIISIVMLLSIVALLPKSNAALISKPGTTTLVNTTISNSYELCQGMKGLGESLYGSGSNVKPHLANNKDWGAVSYLSNSIYGTNTKGGNNGIKVTIDGNEYYSTNGNKSGVMNWGSKPNSTIYTYTGGIIKAYIDLSPANRLSEDSDVLTLANEVDSNSKFVEKIDTEKNGDFNGVQYGMAFNEIINFSFLDNNWKTRGRYTYTPISARNGLFGYTVGISYGAYRLAAGNSRSDTTFRPVVWN